MIGDVTVLIKTFERPDTVARLVGSIKRFYPGAAITVVDDSREAVPIAGVEYIKTEFDIGLSAGRNLGVSYVKTRYVFMCDDDCVFTEETDLAKACALLEESGVDILGIKASGVDYCGTFRIFGGTVVCLRDSWGTRGDVSLYDFVPNIFVARTDVLREHPWDESLKLGEHFAYFYTHRRKLRVGFTESVRIEHLREGLPFYEQYRGRATGYGKQFMVANGIERRIDIHGVIIEATGEGKGGETRSWADQAQEVAGAIERVVPAGGRIALVDEEQIRGMMETSRVVLPFPHRGGEYWGRPPSGEAAIAELENIRRDGVRYMAIAWPARWWLDYYRAFREYLWSECQLVWEDERVLIFDLGTPS